MYANLCTPSTKELFGRSIQTWCDRHTLNWNMFHISLFHLNIPTQSQSQDIQLPLLYVMKDLYVMY